MKKNRMGLVVFLGTMLAAGSAWAAIQSVSAPLQYGSQNTYFAYASLMGPDGTWDEVEADVEALPAYNGLSAHLAVFPNEQSYDWMVANYSNFSGPTPGAWDQAWIGSTNNAGTYEWFGGAGTIPSGSTHWGAWNPPQPKAADHGVVWMFGDYGNVWESQPASQTMGNALIQYGYAVPEPATSLMLVLGAGLFAVTRRWRQD